jgi:MinD-like ATPase involved in chromosome partitioning or flagellar assembly/DNA-binding NarL/FixJ family response regulator
MSLRVLVVSPDPPAEALARFLQDSGYELSGVVDVLDQVPDRVAEAEVVVLNRYTPGASDVKSVLWAIRTEHPDVRVVLLLGEGDREAEELKAAAIAAGVFDWVEGEDVSSELLLRLQHPRSFADVARGRRLPPPSVPEMQSDEPAEPEADEAAQERKGGGILEGAARTFAELSRLRRLKWARDADGEEPPPRARGRPVVVGRVALVLGAHGGAGATSVTALLARRLEREGLRPGVVELPRGGGQMLRLLGADPVERGVEAGLLDVVEAGGVAVLPRGFGPGARIGTPDARPALDRLRAEADAVLVDAGSDVTYPPVQDALAASDIVILVAEPTVTGLASAAQAASSVRAVREFAGLVLNRRPGPHGLSAADAADAVLSRVVADIPWMPAEFRSLSEGRDSPRLLEHVRTVAEMVVSPRSVGRRAKV